MRKLLTLACLFLAACSGTPTAVSEASIERTNTPKRAEVIREAAKLDLEMSVYLYAHIMLQRFRLEDELASLPDDAPRAVAISLMLEELKQQGQEMELALFER